MLVHFSNIALEILVFFLLIQVQLSLLNFFNSLLVSVFFASLLYYSFYSYQYSNYRDSDNFHFFLPMKATTISIAIRNSKKSNDNTGSKIEKERVKSTKII